MSRDIEHITREILKTNKDIHQIDNKFSKEISQLSRDIKDLKKEIKGISNKIDLVLEMFNTLSIFIEDVENIVDESDENEDYQSNEGWIPEINNWEEKYDEDNDEEN